uniref:B-keto acyl reductase family protein n=1 Tax=Rhizophora mucronata TaxID=61149 RepID=A0A2P2PMU6_RHIMU
MPSCFFYLTSSPWFFLVIFPKQNPTLRSGSFCCLRQKYTNFPLPKKKKE